MSWVLAADAMAAPAAGAARPRPGLAHCLLLAALLHLWLVALVGTTPGGLTPPGQGVWGAIQIRLGGVGPADSVGHAPTPQSTGGPVGRAPQPRFGGTVRDAEPQPVPEPGAAELGVWSPTPAPNPLRGPAAPAQPLFDRAPAAALPPVLTRPRPQAAERRQDEGSATAAAPAVPEPPPRPAVEPSPVPSTAPRLAPADTLEAPVLQRPEHAQQDIAHPAVAPAAVALPQTPPAPQRQRPMAQPPPLPVEQLPLPPLAAIPPLERLPDTAQPPAAELPLPAPPVPQATPQPAVDPLPRPLPAVQPESAVPVPAIEPPPIVSPPVPTPTPPPLAAAPEPPSRAAPASPPPTLVPVDVTALPPGSPPPLVAPPTTAALPTPATAPALPPREATGLPAGAAGGSPLAGPTLGPDRATPGAAPASAPALNLELPRARAPQPGLAAPRVLNLLPPPPERKSPLGAGIEKAAKPDCRKAYSGMGVLAVVPLAADAMRDGGCRW